MAKPEMQAEPLQDYKFILRAQRFSFTVLQEGNNSDAHSLYRAASLRSFPIFL